MQCEPRWGDGLSASNSARVERSPRPVTHLAMRADPRVKRLAYRQCSNLASSTLIAFPTASPNSDRITTPASS